MVTAKKEQLEFLNWEFGVFFHFGIRTFCQGHKDWDMKPMPLSAFDPSDLDCDEWLRTAHEAGASYAVLVCKHHDGFANWPSAYTEYGVKNTSWKDGKGDVVREFTDACRKYGLRVGLYYSPAQFGSAQMKAQDYDDYFINQIRELLTNYGKIDYLWFDGCGSEKHQYDTQRIVAAIRRFQPEILLFNMWDPDTRWVGNEAGVSNSPNPLTVSALDFSIRRAEQETLEQARFLPVECDCRMRLENWFYSDDDVHTVKSLDELMGMYYYSVGRGANLLLNIGPDRRGRLPQADKEALLRFGQAVKKEREARIPCQVSREEGKVVLSLDTQLVNQVVLSEKIDPNCAVSAFTIQAYPYPYGAPITVYRGTTIGHMVICPFPTIRTNKLEILVDWAEEVSAELRYLPRYE